MKKILTNTFFLLGIGLLLTVTVVIFLALYIILPSFDDYNKTKSGNDELRIRLNSLTRNLTNLSSINKNEESGFLTLMNNYYPNEADVFRFASLNEQIAADSGLTITSFSASVGAGNSSFPPGGNASGSIGSGSNGAKPTLTLPVTNGYSTQIFYKGNYANFLNLLGDLKKTDRLMAINKLSINPVDSSGPLSIGVNFVLPLSKESLVAASSDSFVPLSEKDRGFLNSLASDVKFRASPANAPLGKGNPFQ